MPPTLRTPLVGDASRSASDSIGGYVFQLWHSVYAWLSLGDDDWLFLEGAEDIDAHGKAVVETNQLKREKTDLSLGTKRAREVIDNFWKVAQGNPKQTVLFRLVSTAGIGKEDKHPFGTFAGIDLWNLTGKSTAQLKTLKAFLNDQDLSKEVLKFLKTASLSDIDQKLFQRLRWDMNQPGTDAVTLAVERKLVLLGYKQGVGPDDSMAVADHLFSLVAAAAASKDEGSKMLDRVLLLKEFEKQTQRMVPVSQLNSMNLLLEKLGSGGEVGATRAIQALQPTLIVRRPPGTMARLGPRSKLLADIWDVILPQTGSDAIAEDTVAVWGRRKAAIAAGRLNVWEKAAAYYEDAAKIVDREEPRQEALSIGLLADSAFALWQAQKRQTATARFGRLLERLAVLPDSVEELKSFKLRKCIAATMVFLSPHGKKARPEVTELPAGFCSDPAIPENLRELPHYPGEYLWVLFVMMGRPADYSVETRRLPGHTSCAMPQASVQLANLESRQEICQRALPDKH
jgi:hypothetical protein